MKEINGMQAIVVVKTLLADGAITEDQVTEALDRERAVIRARLKFIEGLPDRSDGNGEIEVPDEPVSQQPLAVRKMRREVGSLGGFSRWLTRQQRFDVHKARLKDGHAAAVDLARTLVRGNRALARPEAPVETTPAVSGGNGRAKPDARVYVGYMRHLSPGQRSKVKRLRDQDGYPAAIALARKMVGRGARGG